VVAVALLAVKRLFVLLQECRQKVFKEKIGHEALAIYHNLAQ